MRSGSCCLFQNLTSCHPRPPLCTLSTVRYTADHSRLDPNCCRSTANRRRWTASLEPMTTGGSPLALKDHTVGRAVFPIPISCCLDAGAQALPPLPPLPVRPPPSPAPHVRQTAGAWTSKPPSPRRHTLGASLRRQCRGCHGRRRLPPLQTVGSDPGPRTRHEGHEGHTRHRDPPCLSSLLPQLLHTEGLTPCQGCIRTAVHRRRRGGGIPPLDPPPTPVLPFQCWRLTAKFLLRRQEDLSQKFSARLRRGPQGDPRRRGVPAKPPLPPF